MTIWSTPSSAFDEDSLAANQQGAPSVSASYSCVLLRRPRTLAHQSPPVFDPGTDSAHLCRSEVCDVTRLYLHQWRKLAVWTHANVRQALEQDGIWMMGSAGIIASFLDQGEIDEFMIHVIPKFIGEGISVIAPGRRTVPPKADFLHEVRRRRG